MKLRRRLGIEWAGVALAASLIVTGLIYWNSLANFDNLLYDQLSEYDRPAAPDDVLIIAIDEDSLAAFGKWPWSRDRHAELLALLADADPKAIAFDLLLSEPGDSAEDMALADAAAKNENLLLPLHFVFPGSNGADFDIKEPIAPLKQAASAIGHVNLLFDRDGVVRRTSLCFRGIADPATSMEVTWPHLMEQVYRSINGGISPAFSRRPDCQKPLLMPYADRGTFAQVSYAAVANGEMPGAFLKDKIILVGATAQGLGDQHPVPLGDGGTMAGVEIMANLLNDIREDNFITPVSVPTQIALSLIPTWILLIGFWRWRPRTTIFVSVGLVICILAASAILLSLRIWFAPGAALVGLALVYPVWGWRRLQATSDFMDDELKNYRSDTPDIPVLQAPLGPVDLVTEQAEELAHAIKHVRDLRRFISDALTNLPDPMFITDLDGKVKFVNKLAQTGVEDGAQNLALDDMLKRFVAPEDLDDVKDYLALDQNLREHDYVDFTSLNDEVFAMRRARVLSDEGDLRGHIHYLADITEVANAAQEREEVLQLLSHDMRSPQAAILALLDGQDATDDNRRIENHARRTLALADNFVGLARIKSSEFSGEEILLSDLVIEANDSLWPLAKQRGIQSSVEDQTDGAFIIGEPSSLYRSFANLIDNAIKYSPDNSKITIQLRNIAIDKQLFVSVTIADQGNGIAEDMVDHLFERFASNDLDSKGAVKGAGLGLNFVAAVIARHGGTIRAENMRDSGACFTVLLPLAPDPVEPA
ncbi:CHASE2 domain-containing protein [Parasphingorhabdus cellanae]|uniref:histidine kinase n=1 Tax=Parasphingorhabdus cellanae TaxID=2806553 RepID=A0ABX7TA18_9SPHN|nr:CHASE2 domain-containing protein [Parasphingorhabdus cellanae]QTD57240.1 CHASE2 domain-containing protein [Parasphingorhabdus cellanae]